jgi:hypothetical protein
MATLIIEFVAKRMKNLAYRIILLDKNPMTLCVHMSNNYQHAARVRTGAKQATVCSLGFKQYVFCPLAQKQ